MRALVLLVAALWSTAAAARPEGPVRRFAVVAGANTGNPGEPMLRFAESDAERIGRILWEHGGFLVEDTVVLAAPTDTTLRRVLIELNARIRATPGPSALLVYYSGHADAESLHLRGTRFSIDELRKLVSGSAAEVRIMVLDACRSGALTRVKGGRSVPAFVIDLDEGARTQGVAFLTSSAAGEDSQESDELGASFFTHFLASGLLGAADQDDDGAVTLAEAFAYASQRTLAATVATQVGPQHPTYAFDLSGREDLWLTRPGLASGQSGTLVFAEPGAWLVRRGGARGAVVAELVTDAPMRRLAVAPGSYFVVRRDAAFLLQGVVEVSTGGEHRVLRAELSRVEYASVVRKGGTTRTHAWSLFAGAGTHNPVLELGTTWTLGLGARLDLVPLSLEVRGGYGRSDAQNPRFQFHTQEWSAGLAGLRFFDLGPVSLGLGVEASWLGMHQGFVDVAHPARTSHGAQLGPLLQLEVALWGPLHVRLEAEAATAFLKVVDQESLQTPFMVRGTAGLGVFL